MNWVERLDPELAAAFAQFVPEDLSSRERLLEVRALEASDAALLRANRPPIEAVMFEDCEIGGSDGRAAVKIRVYRPSMRRESLPALLWLHGGGLILGTIESDYLLCAQLAREVNCVVVAVDYRLAPEHPFPAALDDARTALQWLDAQAHELGVLRTRIALGGASAGGGLAACLALLNRDQGEVALAFQLLIYPMLDDRNVTPSSQAITDARVWNRAKNLYGWRSYVGEACLASELKPQVSQYAAAARALDLSKLPPAYIAVGALDLFVDEDVDYAARLLQAGVATELHVYPGAFHSFDGAVPMAAISRRFTEDYFQALRRALHE